MTVAEVRLWGRQIGAVAVDGPGDVASFEYTPAFRRSAIEVAPLMMPLDPRRGAEIYRFPELPRPTFHGLPGMLADSLPDKFGNAVIDAWLASQGRTGGEIDAVERLCYTGTRGMGALEFHPARGPVGDASLPIDIEALVALASDVLSRREGLATSFASRRQHEIHGGEPNREQALLDILRVGSSAGGARAKAVIAWNPTTQEVRSGQVDAPEGFEHWLLKFDGVSGNRDKELADPQGYGAIEFAYSEMARACGIEMTATRLLEENGRRHFMTRRFDRTGTGGKLHMQSLGALAHLDFNQAGAHSYEQAILVIRRLGGSMSAIEEMFRRMTFNVVARNQDDHVKNIAFLMDRAGNWSLAPAFDVTWAFNSRGAWTNQHQTSLNAKRRGFTRDDFRAVGKVASMKRGRAETILREVTEAVRRWPEFAEGAGVSEEWAAQIGSTHRLDLIG